MKDILYIFFLLPFACFSQTWQKTSLDNNINNQRYDDIFFLDEKNGWAANGYYASIKKTEDGGLTWKEQLNENTLGKDYYFRNIEFLNKDIGFLGTLNGTIFKTNDGGSTWSAITNIKPNPVAICGLCTIGSSTVYGCGAYFSPAFIIKSIDGGNSWDYQDMSAFANALVEILFLDDNTGFVSGRSDSGGVILKTLDGGNTWTEIYNTNTPGEYVWKMQVLNDQKNIMFASVESVTPLPGKLLKSIDGGANWSSYRAPETDIQAVGFINENHGWMGGHNTGFYETLDGGKTWNNNYIGGNLNRILIINPNLAYASGASVYKFTSENLSTDENSNPIGTSLKISLKNNPVKSKLEFSIQFNQADNILIELYDNNGKFLEQLDREFILSPNHEKKYSYSLDNLQSGVYYLNVHNNFMRESIKFIKD